uniref:Uncharacterized protein n=1 Tax=Salix viminalis TaxID=40686 RepID=A0A6N2N8P6_SALVM
MCKSAAPIFLILFAFAFRLESPSAKLFGIIMVISIDYSINYIFHIIFIVLPFLIEKVIFVAYLLLGFLY